MTYRNCKAIAIHPGFRFTARAVVAFNLGLAAFRGAFYLRDYGADRRLRLRNYKGMRPWLRLTCLVRSFKLPLRGVAEGTAFFAEQQK